VVDREDLVSRTFVELADNLVVDFDIVDVLTTLATRSIPLLGVEAAGIFLADETGRLRVVAASSEDTSLLTLLEILAEHGPAFDCFALGSGLAVADLASSRWPELARAAAARGYHAADARPLRLRHDVIGAFGLLASTSGLDEADVTLAQALADAATISVLQFRALRDARVLTEQLRHALTSRIVIEQAKGMVCERWQTTMDGAFGQLRAYARANNQRLSDVAHDVTTGELDTALLLAPPTG
jgi:hypothetical protein